MKLIYVLVAFVSFVVMSSCNKRDPLFVKPPTPDIEIVEFVLKKDGKVVYSIANKKVLDTLKGELRYPKLRKFLLAGKRVPAICDIAFLGGEKNSYGAEVNFFSDRVNLVVYYEEEGFTGGMKVIQLDDSLTATMLEELRIAFQVTDEKLPSWEETRKRLK